MKCPFCGNDEDKVVDSRPAEDGLAIRRRRECITCGKRFTTYEKIENLSIIVVKKDGTRQPFNADKILSGVTKSCEKRPVSMSQIENLVNSIEEQIKNTLKREISSEEIGEMVMERLKKLDEVAYVRFASVYRQFKDVNSFYIELKDILDRRDRG